MATHTIDPNEPTVDDILRLRMFTAKDVTGVSYAVLNYWNEKGFLLETQKAGEWRKFNFYELAWVYMLNELRELNVELKTLIDPLKNAFRPRSFIETEGVEVQHHELPAETKEKLKGWKVAYDPSYPHGFTYSVWFAIEDKSLLTVRIYGGQEVEVLTSDTLDEDEYALKMMDNSRSFISISLSGIIAKMLGDKDTPTLQKLGILSENELTLLKYLRNNELQSVNIRYSKGEPVLLELKSWTNLEDKNRRLLEVLQSPYDELTFKTNGGKNYGFVRTHKIKLKE
ncbi:MerR family transcriptional regulator [Dinghuibacter silviterrae]|uniref:HTH merR-type domain-containing protein n=1 Tax=Dinghuibacter silviterrae TaxID=1539049 RepID=A0A4R8DPF0_9BACT|nr:MerR family transcriptional regulator [Dinghuibacter silviterrae]TDW99728.1 hypothetical protein EDB95_0739 [Dinghuibacter silviterrae]